MAQKITDVAEYLKRNSMPITETGCWLWLGSCTAQGYGRTGVKRTGEQLAHRVAYRVFIGAINDALVLHRCDVPACVNPEHLYLGTHQDNSDDKVRRRPHLVGGPSRDICKRGHARVASNIYADGSCISCKKIVDHARWMSRGD